MNIRVCANGHLTGQRHCHCGADAVRPLQDRQEPISRHEFRGFLRANATCGAGRPAPRFSRPLREWKLKSLAKRMKAALVRAKFRLYNEWIFGVKTKAVKP